MSLIRYVTRIHFADGVLEDALPEELRVRKLSAPLIVTDADTGEALPRLLDCLPPACRPQVFGPVDPVPEAVARDCDVAIGLGGAVALDLARLAPTAHPGAAAMPSMVVPTLPGYVGLGPLGAGQPGCRTGPRLRSAIWPVPDALFCDPALLSFAAPERLAATGIDALVHCLEALMSTTWNPPADGMAFDGLRRAGIWLEPLVVDPHDGEARREVLSAALNGALAAQKGAGAIHALVHAFEALIEGTGDHGSLHTALIGPVLAFNAPAVPDRLAAAADALRLPGPGVVAGHLQALGERLGLRTGLGHLGLTPPEIERVAAAAAEDWANRTNPRHATAVDFRRMIEAAL